MLSLSTPSAASARNAGMIGTLALTLALTALDPGQVRAQDAGSESAFADTTKPVTFLHEMVITGSRYPRAYYESPQALSFVSRTQMLERMPNTAADILATMPGA